MNTIVNLFGWSLAIYLLWKINNEITESSDKFTETIDALSFTS